MVSACCIGCGFVGFNFSNGEWNFLFRFSCGDAMMCLKCWTFESDDKGRITTCANCSDLHFISYQSYQFPIAVPKKYTDYNFWTGKRTILSDRVLRSEANRIKKVKADIEEFKESIARKGCLCAVEEEYDGEEGR